MPGVDLTTAQTPSDYSHQQIDTAARIAWMLQRGTFVLCELPARTEYAWAIDDSTCETCENGSMPLLGRDFCPNCGRQNDNGRTE